MNDADTWSRMMVLCTVGINNPDPQKSSETPNTQDAKEKKSLLGERTASEKNRHASALMSKSQKNSEDLEEQTLKIEPFLSSQYSTRNLVSQRHLEDAINDS